MIAIGDSNNVFHKNWLILRPSIKDLEELNEIGLKSTCPCEPSQEVFIRGVVRGQCLHMRHVYGQSRLLLTTRTMDTIGNAGHEEV